MSRSVLIQSWELDESKVNMENPDPIVFASSTKRLPLRELNPNSIPAATTTPNLKFTNSFTKSNRYAHQNNMELSSVARELALAKCIIMQQHRQIKHLKVLNAFMKIRFFAFKKGLKEEKARKEKVPNTTTPKKRKLDKAEDDFEDCDDISSRFEASSHPQTPISNKKVQ